MCGLCFRPVGVSSLDWRFLSFPICFMERNGEVCTVAVAMMFSYRWRSWEMLVLMRSAIVSFSVLRWIVY